MRQNKMDNWNNGERKIRKCEEQQKKKKKKWRKKTKQKSTNILRDNIEVKLETCYFCVYVLTGIYVYFSVFF